MNQYERQLAIDAAIVKSLKEHYVDWHEVAIRLLEERAKKVEREYCVLCGVAEAYRTVNPGGRVRISAEDL